MGIYETQRRVIKEWGASMPVARLWSAVGGVLVWSVLFLLSVSDFNTPGLFRSSGCWNYVVYISSVMYYFSGRSF